MKYLRKAAVLIFLLSVLAADTSVAEPTHPNEVGLYPTPDGTGATGTYVVGSPVDVYLVLTRPTDVANGGTPINFITGFELSLYFSPVPNDDLQVMDTVITPNCIDIGSRKDINSGALDFTVAIPDWEAIPVVNEAAVLVRFTFSISAPTQLKSRFTPTPTNPYREKCFSREGRFPNLRIPLLRCIQWVDPIAPAFSTSTARRWWWKAFRSVK